ncbi:MAG: GNAT family N-acetyltransferase [Solirubrobacterales bacterium]|nr:GNAT family N-acetyltransferase [Solirubrobacterales bacterium]
MQVVVRAARPDDAADGLLYVSAAPYYAAYAGGAERARRLLRALYPRGGHTASWEVCRVAEASSQVVGVLAAFPTDAGDELARRFVRLTLAHSSPWRIPGLFRHLRATAAVSPHPPAGMLYVDALATDPAHRRRGVARALLAEADRMAAQAGLDGVALDTGIENGAARGLYERSGFASRGLRPAPDERTARAVGGSGFVGYVKLR